MNRNALIALTVALLALAAFTLRHNTPAPKFAEADKVAPAKRTHTKEGKPICSQVIVPAGDCVPQHLADLPPDPGPAGMQTLEGIDADKDGIRDDVQRFIAENWGESPRAVRVLRNLAEQKLMTVRVGGDLSREETQQLAQKLLNAASCLFYATPELMDKQAQELVGLRVMNTPERYKRASAFNYQMANHVYMLGNETPTQLCGFDPATIQ